MIPPRPTLSAIRVRGARENNLRAVDVDIPHNLITVVTGISGSGKSSLAFDVIFRESQRRYLESFSAHARQFLDRLHRPDVDHLEGLRPAIAVGRKGASAGPRSTVGTLTEIHDLLRLLFARLGRTPPDFSPKLERSLFSFNSPRGACPVCRGLGVEDRIDPDLLIADATRTIRRGALALTTPKGYIIYSQVTMDVLDQVCRAHGFSVDVPWQDLGEAERRIVLEGSDRIRIAYGKHPLESRMRWTGITAKPRQEGTYKGILPVMEGLLKSKRNVNILRYARTLPCRACRGSRLRPEALQVLFQGRTITDLSALSIRELEEDFGALDFDSSAEAAGEPIRAAVLARAKILLRLGLGHLSLDRESTTLSGGEAQRIRLASQLGNGLRGLLYVFDEPSAGLHPNEIEELIEALRELRDKGNTVLIIEHDEAVIRAADQLIDLGPGAGASGGRLLYAGPPAGMVDSPSAAGPTRDLLAGGEGHPPPFRRRRKTGAILVRGARLYNLKSVTAEFWTGALNIVCGVTGAGKSTLVRHILGKRLKEGRFGPGPDADGLTLEGKIGQIVEIDQSPIGRTPRSNPATYTRVFDRIRNLFASLPEARGRGYGKSRFSFNTPGGRCETCLGAGLLSVGMHFLGDVDLPCPACDGRRFNAETLDVKYRGRDIHDVLEMSAEEASVFFNTHPRLGLELEMLVRLGLGYLKLGQSSTTLSGGEAQRVRLAAELMRPESGDTLYILEEPTTGLHRHDAALLLDSLQALIEQGNTVIAVEHDPWFIGAADRLIELGPGSGGRGGRIVVCGTPEDVEAMNKSPTGTALRRFRKRSTPAATTERPTVPAPKEGPIELHGVATHNLKHIDAIFPFQRWTAVTGPSGSGKSSLVFDTLFAESRRLYLESLSFFVRARMDQGLRAECDDARGLTPPIAISPRASGHHPRSTVGTLTEIYDYYRLLYSRAGAIPDGLEHTVLTSAHFSFNHERGACPRCTGLGILAVGDPEALVTDPGISLLKGALDGTKTGRFYGHPQGQFIAALKAAGAEAGVDFGLPFALLNESAKRLALEGSGERLYDIVWAYQRGRREGNFRFQGPWKGFLGLLNEEYERKHADHRGESMRFLMKDESCPDCGGKRIRPEALRSKFLGLDIAEFSALSVEETLRLFADEAAFSALSPVRRAAVSAIRPEITRRLSLLRDVGLDYLTIDRRSATLSGGEAQRLRLAALLGARLTGLTYILDEPTLGLHPRDIENLIGLLRGLVQERNTMIVVDNDFEMISAADRVLDLGPGAGEDGGRIEAQGPPAAIAAEARSATGRALAAARDRPAPWPSTSGSAIRIRGGRANNLQAVDVEIPGGAMTVVTGVSGSGKTSLVFDILGRSAEKGKAVACDSIEGLENFSGRTIVGQDPPARSPLSTVATFTGIIDPLRNAFASSPEAKVRGFGKSHFSYLTPQGRCETCGGEGVLRISLDFLADVETVCEDCRGARFKPSVLAVRWRGLTIADILRTSAAAAAELLGDHRTSRRSLETLVEVGLGYLELGRTLDTLSGGEAQRMKLAAALAAPVAGPVLHLFDEPTAGLHPVDIEKILGVFRRLVREGHTLVVVEHDLDIIARARHIIDLGPAGGNRGGRVVAAGPLEAIASSPESATGAALLKRYGPTAKRPAKDRQ